MIPHYLSVKIIFSFCTAFPHNNSDMIETVVIKFGKNDCHSHTGVMVI